MLKRLTTLRYTSLAATLVLGCAKASIDSTQVAPAGLMVKPPVLFVYDFAVTPEDALTD
jgi:hypothetical protein